MPKMLVVANMKISHIIENRIVKTATLILLIALGGAISAAAVNFFLIPHKFLSGGVSGIAILISYFIPGVNVGLLVAVLNIPLFIIAWRYIDLQFSVYSMVGVASFSLCLVGFSFMSNFTGVHDPLLAAIFGGIVNGAGIGIALRMRGSQGGTDIISVLLRRKFSVPVGLANLYINAAIVSIVAIKFGLEIGLLTIFSQFITSRAMDYVLVGISSARSVVIISDKSKEIADFIIHKTYRGVTFLNGEGGYNHTYKKVIFCVVSSVQLARIKAAMQKIDPEAFMVVSEASETLGKGFYRSPF